MAKHKTSAEVKNRWNEKNYDRITIMAPKGKKVEWTNIAKKRGYKGLSGYIVKCMELYTNMDSENNLDMHQNQ